MRKFILLLASILLMGALLAVPAFADEYDEVNYYENPETGYFAMVIDDAYLLTSSETEKLIAEMKPITEYGDVLFCSTNDNPYTAERYAAYMCEEYCSYNCTIFLIDMDNRKIYIYSEGDIYDVITSGYASSITDNVYTYASDEEYFTCAQRAFRQMSTLLDGGSVSQPMKYICNALLSLIIGLMITYFIVRIVSRPKRARYADIKESMFCQTNIYNTQTHFVGQTRVYDPPSSSRSGGGGGGGRSGGGGGHSF